MHVANIQKHTVYTKTLHYLKQPDWNKKIYFVMAAAFFNEYVSN